MKEMSEIRKRVLRSIVIDGEVEKKPISLTRLLSRKKLEIIKIATLDEPRKFVKNGTIPILVQEWKIRQRNRAVLLPEKGR